MINISFFIWLPKYSVLVKLAKYSTLQNICQTFTLLILCLNRQVYFTFKEAFCNTSLENMKLYSSFKSLSNVIQSCLKNNFSAAPESSSSIYRNRCFLQAILVWAILVLPPITTTVILYSRHINQDKLKYILNIKDLLIYSSPVLIVQIYKNIDLAWFFIVMLGLIKV